MNVQEGKSRGTRKSRSGDVVSVAGNKTVMVAVERRVRHPLYDKVIRRTKKYSVHDEEGKAAVGDRVSFVETRPLSKTKRWRLVDVAAS